MNEVSIIDKSEILSSEDSNYLSTIEDELLQAWKTSQVFRTRTEMEVSVLKNIKHPTPDSKYWQAVREQEVMFGELINLSYEFRKQSVMARKIQADIDKEEDEFAAQLLQIELERTQWMLRNMAKSAHHRLREIREWSDIKAGLIPNMKYGTEDVGLHQLEAMKIRFKAEAALVNQYTPPADARNILGLNQMAQDKELPNVSVHRNIK